jgi:hypothetical protein
LTTEGLFPYIERRGTTVNYTPGTIQPGLFNVVAKILDREQAPKWTMGLFGFDLNVEIEDVMKDYNQFTGIVYANKELAMDMLGGNEGLALSIGFTYLKKAGKNFAFNVMGNFNHPQLYGATGFTTPKLGAFVPLGKKTDQRTKEPIPYIGMIYAATDGYSRKSEIWTLSGAGPGDKVYSKDVRKLCMRMHIGAEHCGGNQMVLLEP